jgi:type IV secretory pathway TraG/TraD family ATPase VirD4
MFDIVQTLPKPETSAADDKRNAFRDAFTAARHQVAAKVEQWEAAQSAAQLRQLHNSADYEDRLCEAVAEARTLKFIDQFFLESFLNLSEKTRSIIDFSFSGFLFRLLRDPVYTLFCRNDSTFTPEDCLNGKIILLNLPVKLYQKIGRDSQIMFKYIWQRAMEKRNIADNGRPVFLWADEAQNFLHEHDAEYQATARSSRIATVYISQNLPNYLANMGGAKSDFRVKSFLGTLGTKIFHANADMETNRYASELIGDGYFEEMSRTATAAGQFSASRTKSLKIDRLVRPEDFTQLKTGGPLNDFRVEGWLHVQGNPVKDGANHCKIVFNQQYIPKL